MTENGEAGVAKVWRLEEYPTAPAETFHLPPDSQRQALVKGHIAKLVFRNAGEVPEPMAERIAERMWVQVTEVRGNGEYLGRLDNDPVSPGLRGKLAAGDPGGVRWGHVINVME